MKKMATKCEAFEVTTDRVKTTANALNLTLCGRAAHASAVEAGKKRTRDDGE